MITDVDAIISPLFYSSVSYLSFAGETAIDGEITETYNASTTVSCAVIPITGDEIKQYPDGQYTMGDVTVISSGTSPLKLRDRITKDSIEYELQTLKNFNELVNIKIFIGKRVTP